MSLFFEFEPNQYLPKPDPMPRSNPMPRNKPTTTAETLDQQLMADSGLVSEAEASVRLDGETHVAPSDTDESWRDQTIPTFNDGTYPAGQTHDQRIADLDERGDRLNGRTETREATVAMLPDADASPPRGVSYTWSDLPNMQDDGSFEISADVKAVRGKNTSDGPTLEIVLDASIDSHVAQVMAMIGKSFTRVRFKPYVVQQRLPETAEPEPLASTTTGEATAVTVFSKGDRVYVTDPGLAQLREIVRQATGTDAPNHHGTVDEVCDDGTLIIAFDEDGVEGAGNAAPYPPDEVRTLYVTGQSRS